MACGKQYIEQFKFITHVCLEELSDLLFSCEHFFDYTFRWAYTQAEVIFYHGKNKQTKKTQLKSHLRKSAI